MKIRALVVEDTALFRKIISEALAAFPEVEVIGTASNGSIGLARIQALRPDLVFLDIEMPELNGLEVLQALRDQKIETTVVMVSAFTSKGSAMTIRSLELGAFDFITKSTEGSLEENREAIRSALSGIIKAYGRKHEIRAILKGGAPAAPAAVTSSVARPKPGAPVQPGQADVERRMERLSSAARAELVAIGISTGGPNALAQMIPQLPADLNAPVFIVQHMPPLFTQSLADSLNQRSVLKVKEAQDNEIARPNTVYIAPGGKQMKVAPSGADILIRITDDPPENNCKPAVDYLFRSLAHGFPGKVCGVIMTGMGNDGTLGLRLMKRTGARVIAQDEASCVVYGMPKEAIEAGVVDIIAPLGSIAEEIRKAVRGF